MSTGGATAGANENQHVFCGAFLNPAYEQTANAVVKTSQTPFQIYVHFDESEAIDPTTSIYYQSYNLDLSYLKKKYLRSNFHIFSPEV